MKWEKVKLGDICKSIADGDHQAPKKQESGIPFITISNIDSNNRIDFTNCLYVSEEYYDAINDKRKASKDDILYSVVGSFGVPVLIKENLKFAFQRHIAILRPDTEKIFPAFMYYCMLTRDFYLQADSVAIGSAQRTITLGALNNMQLSLPSLPVQKRIASILSAYDDLIENNQKQIKLLEEAAQRLYKEWFVDLRFPGHESVKIVDGVPEGWSRTRLDEVIEFNPKVSLTKERIKEFVPMSALSNTAMILDTNEITYTQSNSGSKFKNDDTIMARITPCLENGKIAFVQELKSEEGAVGSTEYIVLRSRLLCPSMVYLLSRMQDFRKYAINNMSGSDGRQRVKVERLMEYEYLKPTNDLVCEFSSKVTPMFKNIKHLSKLNAILREARDRLLPKLMSGEIEV